jgi:hypothetical protein
MWSIFMHTCISTYQRPCVYNTTQTGATEQNIDDVWPSEIMESEVWNVEQVLYINMYVFLSSWQS